MQTFPADDLKYVYSPWHQPVGSVHAGEPFVVDTSDCFTGRFQDPEEYTPESAQWVEENLNPVTGPIVVEGTEAGGAVEVRIEDIRITTPGYVVVSRCEALSPVDWWHEEDHVVNLAVEDGRIHLADGWSVPVRPLIGCLATAPGREAILSRREGAYGGNMDCNEITTGATVLLPVEVSGAFLYFGDCKAAMGDGEVVAAPEVGTTITASAAPAVRPPGMEGIRVWDESRLVTIVSGISLADSCRTAFRQLKLWVESEWGLTSDESALIMGIAGTCGVGQVSNAIHTAKCSIERSMLPSR